MTAPTLEERNAAIARSGLSNREVGLIEAAAEGTAELLTELLDPLVEKLGELLKRVDGLELRLSTVEERPVIRYCGVFEVDRQYSPGEVATHDGSLWHCNEILHGDVPGVSSKWTLCVKRGRDAKAK